MKSAQIIKVLERLPLFFVFLTLLVPLGLGVPTRIGGNEKWARRIRSLDGEPLKGLQISDNKPKLTEKTWMSGVFQKSTEDWLNRQIPLRARVIRTINQLYYSIFAKSYMYDESIVIGRNQELYEIAYIANFCNRAIVTPDAELAGNRSIKLIEPEKNYDFEPWVNDLKLIDSFFKKRGQTFIYLITPSKAAYFPENIPANLKCSQKTPRLQYQMAINYLQKTKINYVDGSQIILKAKGKYPVDLFPRGGTHWTMLGASLVTRELITKIAKTSGRSLPTLEFSYVVEQNPTGTDTDLLDLLNLWSSVPHYPVPKLTFRNVERQPLRLAVVGGSFVHQIMDIFEQTGTFCRMDHYYYFKIEHLQYPGSGECGTKQTDPNDLYGLLTADVVVLEENEVHLRSKHFELLKKAIIKEKNSK